MEPVTDAAPGRAHCRVEGMALRRASAIPLYVMPPTKFAVYCRVVAVNFSVRKMPRDGSRHTTSLPRIVVKPLAAVKHRRHIRNRHATLAFDIRDTPSAHVSSRSVPDEPRLSFSPADFPIAERAAIKRYRCRQLTWQSWCRTHQRCARSRRADRNGNADALIG